MILALWAVALMFTARGDEGMWIPSLIGKNYDEMVRLGLKLSKEDLYSLNQASLKDAIVQFGGGCTGEIISSQGLLITNHHCGYSYIAGLSSVEKNYLDNGFWAKKMEEELPAPGLSVIFLQRIVDVTEEVSAYVGNAKGEAYNKKFEEIKKQIETRASKKGKFVASVKEYFNGNQILLLTYKRYTDVRLVGTPPKSLGKFGGDTDNWMWPRHTADFSMFRVYADSNNQPAAFSAFNKPYHPKKFLPVSIAGEKEGDFAMIYGYPGRTNRYEVAAGLRIALSEVNPSIVNIREKRLSIMRKFMDANKVVYLNYTGTYASIANYWKYFIGQTEQLKRLHVVDKKEQQETAFTQWAKTEKPEYANLIADYNKAYSHYAPYAKHATYYSEAFRAPTLTKIALMLEPLAKALERGQSSADSLEKYIAPLKVSYRSLLKGYDQPLDQELFSAMTNLYYSNVPADQLPIIFQEVIFKKYGHNTDKAFIEYAAHVFKNTFLLDSNKFNAFMNKPTLKQINNDPAIGYAFSIMRNWEQNYASKIESFNEQKKEYAKQYVKGLMEWKPNQLFYPDANSTMRISYGQVLGYTPKDGMHYNYFTTIDGMMDKYKPGDREFDVPQDLIDIYRKRDFGSYADKKGTIRTCFITNNDITGGNSGSPVMNANGELIGLAFDGNWEAMSGDIAFDKKYKRTICVDSRYVLFLIEKLGKARNLIDEMEIRN
ncbi:MAG: S46 family peptidase [Bacteroidetes bacterium]|nr:S46 family peptidase [Bacteroidota bacterium]MBS1739573.1 S46 family peptidase [Bacteroidota bacterium]